MMFTTVPLVTSSPRFAPQRARRCLTWPRKSSANSLRSGAIGAQARLVDPALGEELAEDRQRHEPREHRRPAQKARLKRDLQLPLERLAQPALLDDQKVVAGARRGRLVLAQRDPRVKPWAPRVVLPPRARVVRDQQMPVAAPEDPGPRIRPAKLAGAPGALPDQLVLPVLKRAVDQRTRRRAPGATAVPRPAG